MVMMRWSSGMNDDSTLSSVVFPVPVPPLTMTLSRPSTPARMRSVPRGVMVPSWMRSSAVNGSLAKSRIVSTGPSTDSGGMMALTRDPSGSLASTIGDDSSIRRPTWETMRSMTRRRWAFDENRISVSSMRPERSM